MMRELLDKHFPFAAMFKCCHVFLVILTFLFLALIVSAQFPRVCLTVDTLTRKECCPVPRGFEHQCGAPRRGVCRNIKPEHWNEDFDHYKPMHEHDERVRWPTVFFNRSCHCKAKFDGFDCSRCAFGRYGRNCDFFRTRKRRNIHHLSLDDALKYQKYLVLARRVRSPYQVMNTSLRDMWGENGTLKPMFCDVSVFDYYVWSHHYSAFFPPGVYDLPPNLSHNGQGFPTWHRHFVLALERDLQELSGDSAFAIPYWDWTQSPSCDACTETFAGKTVASGDVIGWLIRNWYAACSYEGSGNAVCDINRIERRISRHPERTKQALPVRSDIDDLMRFSVYDDVPYNLNARCAFRCALEGCVDVKTGLEGSGFYMHNAVHEHFGGTMGNTITGPNDLVFWLHHAFVDRLLEKGIRRYQFGPLDMTDKGAPFGHNRRSAIVPFFPVKTHEDMLKRSYMLGYDYEDVDRNGYSSTDGDEEPRIYEGCLK